MLQHSISPGVSSGAWFIQQHTSVAGVPVMCPMLQSPATQRWNLEEVAWRTFEVSLHRYLPRVQPIWVLTLMDAIWWKFPHRPERSNPFTGMDFSISCDHISYWENLSISRVDAGMEVVAYLLGSSSYYIQRSTNPLGCILLQIALAPKIGGTLKF